MTLKTYIVLFLTFISLPLAAQEIELVNGKTQTLGVKLVSLRKSALTIMNPATKQQKTVRLNQLTKQSARIVRAYFAQRSEKERSKNKATPVVRVYKGLSLDEAMMLAKHDQTHYHNLPPEASLLKKICSTKWQLIQLDQYLKFEGEEMWTESKKIEIKSTREFSEDGTFEIKVFSKTYIGSFAVDDENRTLTQISNEEGELGENMSMKDAPIWIYQKKLIIADRQNDETLIITTFKPVE